MHVPVCALVYVYVRACPPFVCLFGCVCLAVYRMRKDKRERKIRTGIYCLCDAVILNDDGYQAVIRVIYGNTNRKKE